MFRNLALSALVAGVMLAVPMTAVASPSLSKPVITRFNLTSVKPSQKVVIDGKYFTHVTWVKIDGIRAKFKVLSPMKIDATVPKLAKTGKVEVMTKAGFGFSLHVLKIL